MRRLLLLAALMLVVLPRTVAAATTKLAYNFGFRQVTTDTLQPAVEFALRYEINQSSTDPRWHHFNYSIFTQGYQTFSPDIRDVDHMEFGLAMSGRHYRTQLSPLPPALQDHYTDLLERSEAGGGPGITDAQVAELNALMAMVRENRSYVGYSVYGRFVTDQQVDSKLINMGLGIQAEVPLLGGWLDAPFKATRGGSQAVAQPLRASLSAEYVKGVGDRKDSYPRAFLEAIWTTRAFDKLYPRVRWQAEYATDGPSGLDHFNQFLDAGIALPVTATTSVVFKYLYGRTAPNYQKVNAAVLGFDVVSW